MGRRGRAGRWVRRVPEGGRVRGLPATTSSVVSFVARCWGGAPGAVPKVHLASESLPPPAMADAQFYDPILATPEPTNK